MVAVVELRFWQLLCWLVLDGWPRVARSHANEKNCKRRGAKFAARKVVKASRKPLEQPCFWHVKGHQKSASQRRAGGGETLLRVFSM